MDSNSYTNTQFISLGEVIANQSWEGGWVCPDCIYYRHNLTCDKNMFISFEGCYTKGCCAFKNKTLVTDEIKRIQL